MTSRPQIFKKDLLYPEKSYEIIGALLEVYKQLGSGHQEKHYQKAVAKELQTRKLLFQEQFPIKLTFKDSPIGTYFADFVIENKIVLELKTDRFFSRRNIEQVYGYLKALRIKLGILANFTSHGLEYKRIVNIK